MERVVVAVSKMDACGYSRGRFDEIRGVLSPFLATCGFGEDRVAWTPVSGVEGVNLALPNAGPNAELAAWWDGPTLVGAIDALPPVDRGAPLPLRMPVSDVVAGEVARSDRRRWAEKSRRGACARARRFW